MKLCIPKAEFVLWKQMAELHLQLMIPVLPLQCARSWLNMPLCALFEWLLHVLERSVERLGLLKLLLGLRINAP